jgi:hypothetical protein
MSERKTACATQVSAIAARAGTGPFAARTPEVRRDSWRPSAVQRLEQLEAELDIRPSEREPCGNVPKSAREGVDD